MLTMVHANSVMIRNGMLTVDRKFHLGMLKYCEHIPERITAVNPVFNGVGSIMDAIELPLCDLPYEIVAIDAGTEDDTGEVGGRRKLREIIGSSRLVYGVGLDSAAIARQHGVRYIQILEYDLQTQIVVTTLGVQRGLRRAVRAFRLVYDYYRKQVPDMRHAYALHCNGYPIYDASDRYSSNRLLYLDSRMSADMLMDEAQLGLRLSGRVGQTLRLLYSGRYERLKGADDVVRVAVQCLARGLDIELHCYGQGSLKTTMQALSAGSDRIHIHDAIPYPELVNMARTFDVFVCCHIQNDPSCTYLESFGAGLPVVGYANRMWRRLCQESGAGLSSPVGKPAAVVADIERLAMDSALLSGLSRKALAFARGHCFEREFQKRVDGINAALEDWSV